MYNRRCFGVRGELIDSYLRARIEGTDEKLLQVKDASEGLPSSYEFHKRAFFITANKQRAKADKRGYGPKSVYGNNGS